MPTKYTIPCMGRWHTEINRNGESIAVYKSSGSRGAEGRLGCAHTYAPLFLLNKNKTPSCRGPGSMDTHGEEEKQKISLVVFSFAELRMDSVLGGLGKNWSVNGSLEMFSCGFRMIPWNNAKINGSFEGFPILLGAGIFYYHYEWSIFKSGPF